MSDKPVAQSLGGTVEAWAVYYFPDLELMNDEKYAEFLAAVVGYGEPDVLWAFSDYKTPEGRCAFCATQKIAGECPGVQVHAMAQYEKFEAAQDVRSLRLDKFEVSANLLLGPLFVEVERQINARAAEETEKYRRLYKK